MKSSVTITLLIILSAIYVHSAEIEEISLTSLQGTYSAENLFDTDVRTAAFVFVGTPTDIHSVRIRICGESFPSFYMCDWWPKEAAWRLDYKATFYDTISGGYLEAFVETSNSMEVLPSEELALKENLRHTPKELGIFFYQVLEKFNLSQCHMLIHIPIRALDIQVLLLLSAKLL